MGRVEVYPKAFTILGARAQSLGGTVYSGHLAKAQS